MKRLMIVAVAALLAGCESMGQTMSSQFGVAQKSNFDAMVVDPTPAEGAPEGDAAKADLAVGRYKADKVDTGAEEESGAAVTLKISPGS